MPFRMRMGSEMLLLSKELNVVCHLPMTAVKSFYFFVIYVIQTEDTDWYERRHRKLGSSRLT